jgi:HSP20 family protein
MTLVRLKNRPGFNNIMNHPFPSFTSLFGDEAGTVNYTPSVPVNVLEKEGELVLEVVAPGFEKEDFVINLEKELLTISAETRLDNKGEEGSKKLRTEYKFRSFKRSFTLPETADAERISAQYVNGILRLNLPPKEDVKPVVKQIAIQ